MAVYNLITAVLNKVLNNVRIFCRCGFCTTLHIQSYFNSSGYLQNTMLCCYAIWERFWHFLGIYWYFVVSNKKNQKYSREPIIRGPIIRGLIIASM
jgi:hypothetical protein